MPAHRPRENDFLNIAAFLDEIFGRVTLVDADDILLDDGAIVENLRNVMSGGPDQLDSPLKGLMVRFRPDECGQEGVVNIDQVCGAQRGDEFIRKHLHVAREHNETAAVFAHECDLSLLRLALVFLGDRHDEIGDAVKIRDPLVIGVVGNDQRDLTAEFATLVPVEQVLQAVVILGNENRDSRTIANSFGSRARSEQSVREIR